LTIVDWGFLIFDYKMRPQELEDRPIDFAVAAIDVVESLPDLAQDYFPEPVCR
jgi:hypothetical protein